MKVLIDNSGYELKNSGDVSMLVVAISRINNLLNNPEITVFTVNPSRLKELFPNVKPLGIVGRHQWNSEWNILGGIHKLFPKRFNPCLKKIEDYLKLNFYELSKSRILSKMLRKKQSIESINTYLHEVESADLVITTGGGFVTDAFAEHASRIMSTLLLAQSLNKMTAMFGQGLGPVSDRKLISISKKVFPNLDFLGLREGVYSPVIANEFGLSSDKIIVTGDDAIEMAHALTPKELGDSIGINLRVASYSSINNLFLERIRKVLNLISDDLKTGFVPVPISGHDDDSDFKSISILLKKELNHSEFMTSEQVIKKVSSCRVVVTGSYHAAVYALSQGISVVVLIGSDYYKQKFVGLENQFKVGCRLVNTSLEDFEVVLESAIREMWENAASIRNELLIQAQAQISLSRESYEKILSEQLH
ncbi:polysaccharide pyruvyl transferase family protein [Methylophaga sp.]|uniref:polysaccharide pyruvyl transferase family protein n=1 Tax=Methylophaga sp. TaxID=2024840 RepID=UPI003A933381